MNSTAVPKKQQTSWSYAIKINQDSNFNQITWITFHYNNQNTFFPSPDLLLWKKKKKKVYMSPVFYNQDLRNSCHHLFAFTFLGHKVSLLNARPVHFVVPVCLCPCWCRSLGSTERLVHSTQHLLLSLLCQPLGFKLTSHQSQRFSSWVVWGWVFCEISINHTHTQVYAYSCLCMHTRLRAEVISCYQFLNNYYFKTTWDY